MSDERRYQEDEVREIFEAAARARDAEGVAHPSRDGLTLAQLQEIGRDVGLSPARIAEAATALDLHRGARPRGTHLAMPVSVGMTVPLPRALDDHEWSLLVAELRQTFRARGQDRSSGSGRREPPWRSATRIHARLAVQLHCAAGAATAEHQARRTDSDAGARPSALSGAGTPDANADRGGTAMSATILPFPPTRRRVRKRHYVDHGAGFLTLQLLERDGEAIPANVQRIDEPDGPQLPERSPDLLLALFVWGELSAKKRDKIKGHLRCLAYRDQPDPCAVRLLNLLNRR